jgi:hypothetical protein
MQHLSSYHHSRTNQGSDRVKLFAQHGGNLPHEDIAHHAAADSSKHAEQNRGNWPGVKG